MKIISTDQAPAAIGPYSQAITSNGFLFSSGQIALSPQTGELIEGGIEAQTQQALANLKHILNAGGAEINTLIKVVIFLKNMNDFATVNKIYESWVGNHRPARSTIEVAALPRQALIEIECVAHVK